MIIITLVIYAAWFENEIEYNQCLKLKLYVKWPIVVS